MSQIFDERAIAGCFYKQISLLQDNLSIRQQIREAMAIEHSVKRILKGEAPIWEVMEEIEAYVFDIDQYCDEVEANLEEVLIVVYA